MTIELALAAPPSSTAGAGGGMPSPLPPGFRFHPTDEELILHYLCKRAAAAPCPAPIIAEVDIYKFDPWDLPGVYIYMHPSSPFSCVLIWITYIDRHDHIYSC
jgi:hypothetical protein